MSLVRRGTPSKSRLHRLRHRNQFRPAFFRGMIALYDAAKGITLNGSDVSAWLSQGRSSRPLAQSTAGLQPVYEASNAGIKGRPCLTFGGPADGNSMVTSAWPNTDAPFMVFIVSKIDGYPATDGGYVFQGGALKPSLWFDQSEDKDLMRGAAAGGILINKTSVGAWRVHSLLYKGTAKAWVDGVLINSGAATMTTFLNLTIGDSTGSADNDHHLEGSIAYMIFFDRELSPYARKKVENYLLNRF